MADLAGSLSFGFDADFSGFTRAADGAGRTLDQLGRNADAWATKTASGLSRTFDAAAGVQSARAGAIGTALDAVNAKARAATADAGRLGLSTAQVLGGASVPDTSGDKDDDSAKVLTNLSERLALLRTTGTAHDAIVERMKIEVEQAKLGADATATEKSAVAGLVAQIDAATAARTRLKAAQDAVNEAWSFGSGKVAQGLESLILDGGRLNDIAAGLLKGVARQGLQGALVGTGPFAGLFGTQGADGWAGGLFGALGRAVAGSGSPAPSGSGFAGFFAGGGTIAAGQWGVVGERGAEVVAGPAAILPMSRASGAPASGRSTQVINFNVTTPDAPSFARSESQMAALLSRAASRGQRNL